MKPYDDLSKRGKFIRKNVARLVIYGGAILVCLHSCYRIKKIKEAEKSPIKKSELTYL